MEAYTWYEFVFFHLLSKVNMCLKFELLYSFQRADVAWWCLAWFPLWHCHASELRMHVVWVKELALLGKIRYYSSLIRGRRISQCPNGETC